MTEDSGERPSPRISVPISAEPLPLGGGHPGRLIEGELTYLVIGCFYRVHTRLRDGYLEAVYVEALRRELLRAGLTVEKEAILDVWDEGERVGHYCADLLVEGRLVLEIKAGEALPVSARRQLLNYLRCIDQPVGLLLHFGSKARFYRIIQSANSGRTSRAPR